MSGWAVPWYPVETRPVGHNANLLAGAADWTRYLYTLVDGFNHIFFSFPHRWPSVACPSRSVLGVMVAHFFLRCEGFSQCIWRGRSWEETRILTSFPLYSCYSVNNNNCAVNHSSNEPNRLEQSSVRWYPAVVATCFRTNKDKQFYNITVMVLHTFLFCKAKLLQC